MELLGEQSGSPLSDMAKNAWLGRELARDVRELAPLELLRHLNAHDSWPFGFSLLLVPSYLLVGESFTAAALVSTLCFALLPLALVALARQVDSGAAALAGALLASVLVLGSPLAAASSLLILRETAGMLFLTVAATLHLRAARHDTLGAWRLAAGAALWLFFVKYNYALFFLVAAMLDRATKRSAIEWKQTLSTTRAALGRCRSPNAAEPWIAASILALAGALALDWSPGTLLFGLLLLWTVALAVRWRTLGRRAVTWARSQPPAVRATLEMVVVPIWIWCLGPSPMHTRGLVHFLTNRDSGLGTIDGARFYLHAFVEQLLPGTAIAVAAVIGIVAAVFARPASARLRFLALLAATTVVLPLFHPYKLERFLLTALPALLLLAGLGWAWLAERLALAAGAGRWARAAALLLPVTLLPTLETPPVGFVEASYRASSGPESLRPALETLIELAPPRGRVAVVGTFNALSTELVWWEITTQRSGELELVRSPPRIAAGAPSEAVDRHVERWLRRRRPESILAISVDASSPLRQDEDFRRFSLWQERVVESLARNPEWSELALRRLDDQHLELALYGRRSRAAGDS